MERITIADIYYQLNNQEYSRKHAIPMMDAICERAIDDIQFKDNLNNWLCNGGTILFRDEIAAPFKNADFLDYINHFYPFDDNWMAIDSAHHSAHYASFNSILLPFLAKACAEDLISKDDDIYTSFSTNSPDTFGAINFLTRIKSDPKMSGTVVSLSKILNQINTYFE